MDKYLDILLSEVNQAEIENEIPVAAIIVKDGKIIAKSHNSRLKSNRVISHAEVNAIILAEEYIGDWRLNGCDMYVTLEPCEMCMHIIREARIDNVYYLLERQKNKHQFNKTNICSFAENYKDKRIEKYKKKLGDFFKLSGKR